MKKPTKETVITLINESGSKTLPEIEETLSSIKQGKELSINSKETLRYVNNTFYIFSEEDTT
jgi:hypothetical protein